MVLRKILHATIICSVVAALPVQPASAQTRDAQLWNSLILDYLPSSNLQLEVELIYNLLLSEGPQWYEYAMQPSIEYYPNNSIDLFAATYLSTTQQDDDTQTNEVRPIVGFRWNIIKPEKRVFLRTQVKYEYRIFTDKTTDDVINSGRVRARLDLFVPITRKSYSEDGDLYGIIWTEAYFNNDERINEKYQSTFRQYLGLGYRFSFHWRLETSYVLQASRDTIIDDQADNISNVIFITLKRFVK
jgi:hypothetical protein